MTYEELYNQMQNNQIGSVNDLVNAISGMNLNSGNNVETLSDNNPTNDVTQTTTTNNNGTTVTPNDTSAYSFENWVKQKGYTYNYDQATNTYKLNNTTFAPENFSGLTNGYGTEAQYNTILNNFLNTSQAAGQYQSQYSQQMQDLLNELNQFSTYQTPEELNQYLMNLVQSANEPFTYNPATDTGLIGAQQQAGTAVRESAGAKGTLYGSATLSNIAQAQGALIPQYEEKAYSRYADTQNRKIQLATTLMQWDQMQSDRNQDQLDLIKTKYDYIMGLDIQSFNEFQAMLDQKNFEKQYALEKEQLQIQKQVQELEEAYKRIDALGYVDNTTSVITGLPVGTKAQWALQLEQEQKMQLEQMKKEQANALKLQQEQAKIDKALTQYKASLDLANQKTLAAKQYEYDKSLAKLQNELQMSSLTGASSIVSNAKTYLGTKYVYGGNSKTKGLDCSALTQQVMAQAGVSLPRTAYEQSKVGTKVSWSDLQPGDLIFFDTIANSKNVDHVGIYVGNGQMIHASSGSGKVTQVSINTSYWQSRFTVARRNSSGGSYNISAGYDSSSGSVGVGKNSSSASTKSVQTLLNKLGYGLTVDGSYGMKTTEAVRAFQSAYKLTVDGVVGPKTLAKLQEVVNSKAKKTTTTSTSNQSYWQQYAASLK